MAGLKPEVVGDVESGEGSDIEVGGMTAEEQAQFDAMREGRDVPGDGAADGDGAGEGDGDADVDASAADGAGAGDGDAGATDRDGAESGGEGEKRAPPKTISYGKYQREAKKQQDAITALQARLDGAVTETKREREERLRLDERTKMLLEAISAKPKADAATAVDTDPEPNKDDDPIGHLEWKNRQLEKTVTELKTGRQKDVEQSTAQNEERDVLNFFTADLEREAQTDPTFGPAFVHLRESRYTELGYIYAGIDINDKAAVDAALTPDQQAKLSQDIQRSFHNEQLMVAREAIQKKISPAKVVANLARARGYKPAAAPPAAASGKKNGNGAAVPAAPAAPARTVTEELAAVRDGLAASKSLSDAGGSPGDTLTPQRIADMSEDEFFEFYNSMPKAKLDRLMGKSPN